MTSDRAALALLAALAVTGCGVRDVTVDVYTPSECCAVPGCTQPECPLANARCVETRLERVDGTVATVERVPVPEGLCDLGDLAGFVLLERGTQPSDSVEVRVEGWTGLGCDGVLVFGCESFGEHVVDLERDSTASLWCDCPYAPAP